MKPGMLKAYIRVIKLAYIFTLKQSMMDAFILFGIFVQPLLIAIMALFILGEQGDGVVIFIVVGSGLTGLWDSVLFQSGSSITRERWTGTLEVLVAMPTPLGVIVFGKNLAFVTQSLGSMIIAYTCASIIFGYPLSVESPSLFIVSIVLTVLSLVCMGLVLATLFVLNPDMQRWSNGLEFPVFILAGFLFPIAILPQWTTPLSYILAPYWAAVALHMSSSGNPDILDISLPWAMMALLGVLYLFLAFWLFKKMLFKARVDATLIGQ
ncbi:MAG: ABC transporter permease [Anaerolineales bacterium]|nr:MAG: ABC transporter permease [Anaerolineales bacterium]